MSLTSSDISVVFKIVFESFKDIPYATLETEFPIDAIIKLFRILDINPGIVRNPKDRTKAVQEFRAKALNIKEELEYVKRGLEAISTETASLIDKQELFKKAEELEDFPINSFLAVKMVNDFKKVEYNDQEITNISLLIELLSKLKGFLEDYNSFIYKDLLYINNAIDWLDNYANFFIDDDILALKGMYNDCILYVENIDKLLDAKDRNILKGKLQQFKLKYSQLYYTEHAKAVGSNIKWSELDKINQSEELKVLRDLKAIKAVNLLELNKLDNQILSKSRLK